MNRKSITENPLKSVAKGFAKGFQAGKKSPDMLNRGIDKALDPSTYGDDKSNKKIEYKPVPVAPVKVEPNMPIPKDIKQIPKGTGFKDNKGVLWQWAGQTWVKKMPGGWQGGQVSNQKGFAMYIDALKLGKAYKPTTRENDMRNVKEGLGDLAHAAEKDHEVQMARAELYKLAKYAIKLHDMLKGVSEAEGLEGWVQSKITKSANDIGQVYHHMDYEKASEGVTEARDTHCSDKCCGSDVKAEDCTCAPSCEHCNCNAVNEGKSPHKKGTKKYKKHMAAMHAESAYKSSLHAKLAERAKK